jgi:hypothetical protein
MQEMPATEEGKLRRKLQLAEAAYEAKTKPIADMDYLRGIHQLAVEKKKEADVIWHEMEARLAPVLDEFGVAGPLRLSYRNFGRRLLSYFLKYPESVWQSYIDALKTYYTLSQKLHGEWLDRIAEVVVQFAKDIREGRWGLEDGGKEA